MCTGHTTVFVRQPCYSPDISVRLSCCNKTHQVASQHMQLWRLGSSRPQACRFQCLVRARFLDAHLFAVSTHGRTESPLLVALCKNTNSTHEGSTLMTSSPPKAPLPNTVTLGVQTSTYEFKGGVACIQPMAPAVPFWTNDSISLYLGFFICKVGIVRVPIFLPYKENSEIKICFQ